MKYMITWNERPQGSPMEYEKAQKRILEVFSPWKAPANFKIEAFVIRVGDWGGYMLMECDDPLEVHKFCSMLPAFTFEARPVVPVAHIGHFPAAVPSATPSALEPRRHATDPSAGAPRGRREGLPLGGEELTSRASASRRRGSGRCAGGERRVTGPGPVVGACGRPRTQGWTYL